MKKSLSELAYRAAAIQGATHIGLLLVVYDALADDLDQAGVASSQVDVPGRCNKSVHALHLLGHLESWTAYLDDGSLRSSLDVFYTFLRTEIVRLQQAGASTSFAGLAAMVRETRAVWQRKEQEVSIARPTRPLAEPLTSPASRQTSVTKLSWSA